MTGQNKGIQYNTISNGISIGEAGHSHTERTIHSIHNSQFTPFTLIVIYAFTDSAHLQRQKERTDTRNILIRFFFLFIVDRL